MVCCWSFLLLREVFLPGSPAYPPLLILHFHSPQCTLFAPPKIRISSVFNFSLGGCNCPFRGCAGDWVKLGVAKRYGAVLGDAVSKMADENTKVQLVESDIPGAELPKPAEFCTVAILKRWLSCRGAKVSGNLMSFSYKHLTLASLGKV